MTISQGRTQGAAQERRTARSQHDRQTFVASEDEPYWIIVSDKTGATAAHRPSSLRKL